MSYSAYYENILKEKKNQLRIGNNTKTNKSATNKKVNLPSLAQRTHLWQGNSFPSTDFMVTSHKNELEKKSLIEAKALGIVLTFDFLLIKGGI